MAVPVSGDGAELFSFLDSEFGHGSRFVTVAFITHLVPPRTVPIFDQHNFRATNDLLAGVRRGWTGKKAPSRDVDVVLLSGVMRAVRAGWKSETGERAPSLRELEKFLMMYGKSIKPTVG